MITYSEIESIIWENLKTGQCYTLPIPITSESDRVLAVLLFSCDRKSFSANEPTGWLLVDLSTNDLSVRMVPAEYFGSVAFCPSASKGNVEARACCEAAKALFGKALGQDGESEDGALIAKYALDVMMATQPSLRPYLRIAAPELFKGGQ